MEIDQYIQNQTLALIVKDRKQSGQDAGDHLARVIGDLFFLIPLKADSSFSVDSVATS